MEISKITANLVPQSVQGTVQAEEKSGFGGILAEMLEKTNSELQKSEQMSQDYALGKDVELHKVVLAAEQANLALQMTVQVRNKIIEAYQEITRMQL